MRIISFSPQREFHIHNDRLSVYCGRLRLFALNISSMVNSAEKTDRDLSVAIESSGETEIVWRAESALWDEKTYTVKISDNAFRYSVEVSGPREATDVLWFSGSGREGSDCRASGLSLPADPQRGIGNAVLPVSSLPAKTDLGGFAFPIDLVPFCSCYGEDRFAIGIHGAEKVRLLPGAGPDGCALYFEGGIPEEDRHGGRQTVPAVFGVYGRDEADLIYKYRARIAPGAGIKAVPDAERRTFFSGAHIQELLSREQPGTEPEDFCTQELYEKLIGSLWTARLGADSLIIGRGWQYADPPLTPDCLKWPDMRAFVKQADSLGMSVLADTGYNGGADASETAEAVAKLISGTGLSGLRIDLSVCDNKNRALAYARAVYEAAKAADKNSYIIINALDPDFGEFADSVCLRVSPLEVNDPLGLIARRASLAAAVYPGLPIDTGVFPARSPYEAVRITEKQREYGTVDLCFPPNGLLPDEADELRKAAAFG